MDSGRVVLITGASSGIGEGIARLLASEGHIVLLLARRVDRLNRISDEIGAAGGKAEVYECDVTDPARLDAVVADATAQFGRVDVLVNNAGLMPLSLLKNRKRDEAHRMVDVNLKGAIDAVYAVLPGMLERNSGHIVNVSSVAAKIVGPATSVYSATKHALRAFSDGLRQEMAMDQKNIRVTDIQPGAVTTELISTITDPDVAKIFAAYGKLRPLKPADIARAVAYAISQPDEVNVNEITIRPVSQQR
jgi:NADP-dependent 3-hydroxy acid dehydrogenase YdfG